MIDVFLSTEKHTMLSSQRPGRKLKRNSFGHLSPLFMYSLFLWRYSLPYVEYSLSYVERGDRKEGGCI